MTELVKAEKNLDVFGTDFVKTCPILDELSNQMAKNITGTDKCTYEVLFQVSKKFIQCQREAIELKEQLLNMYTPDIKTDIK